MDYTNIVSSPLWTSAISPFRRISFLPNVYTRNTFIFNEDQTRVYYTFSKNEVLGGNAVTSYRFHFGNGGNSNCWRFNIDLTDIPGNHGGDSRWKYDDGNNNEYRMAVVDAVHEAGMYFADNLFFAGFVDPYKNKVTSKYSDTHMNLLPTAGATWTSSSILTIDHPPTDLADNDYTISSEFHTNTTPTPHWAVVELPYQKIVNKVRMRGVMDRGAFHSTLFKLQARNLTSEPWTDIYVRSVSNGWEISTRGLTEVYARGVNEDMFYFPNTTPYKMYRLLDTSNLSYMVLSTLDLFYVDPAGVDVHHYESYYSTPMPRFADTFTDRSTVPRSLSYKGYTMSQGTNVTITGFSASSSPITPSGDFTVMVPVRIVYETLGAGDRFAYFTLGVASQIRYNDGTELAMYGVGNSTTPVALPAMASRWYNNYHVLSTVYTASTNKCKVYLHYYTNDSNVVSSISTPENTIQSHPRQELKLNWQGSSQPLGNINIRPVTMFPSALSETVLTAAAKKILKVGYVPSLTDTVFWNPATNRAVAGELISRRRHYSHSGDGIAIYFTKDEVSGIKNNGDYVIVQFSSLPLTINNFQYINANVQAHNNAGSGWTSNISSLDTSANRRAAIELLLATGHAFK